MHKRYLIYNYELVIVQPGHIEFGTWNWSLWECLDGIMNRQIAHGRIRRHIPIGSKNSLTCIWRPHP